MGISMVIIEQESIHSFSLKIINWDRRGHHNKENDCENEILGLLIELSSIYRTDIEIKYKEFVLSTIHD